MKKKMYLELSNEDLLTLMSSVRAMQTVFSDDNMHADAEVMGKVYKQLASQISPEQLAQLKELADKRNAEDLESDDDVFSPQKQSPNKVVQ